MDISMTRDDALAEIREVASHRDKIIFTTHALIRDPKKGKHPITERQAAQCLQQGFLTENPTPDIKLANGWKFTCRRMQEEVVITVAGVIVPATKIVVITGYETRPFRRRPTSRLTGKEG
jgi:hypothetical protein